MICPSCAWQADADTFTLLGRRPNPPHDPAICRDAAIQPHGCTCQHGQPKEPAR